MALLMECPECRRRNSQKVKACKKCGFALAKFSGRICMAKAPTPEEKRTYETEDFGINRRGGRPPSREGYGQHTEAH
jgi:hypothetical protein